MHVMYGDLWENVQTQRGRRGFLLSANYRFFFFFKFCLSVTDLNLCGHDFFFSSPARCISAECSVGRGVTAAGQLLRVGELWRGDPGGRAPAEINIKICSDPELFTGGSRAQILPLGNNKSRFIFSGVYSSGDLWTVVPTIQT